MNTATGPEDLVRIGRQAGLDAVGICDAAPFVSTRRQLEERKEAGLSAGMAFTYRNPARSTDPSVALPGARALVVGARGYLRTRPAEGATAGPEGRVGRYAWVDHYQPLREALGVVADRLREDGWKALVLADDNSLVDRAAAVRAGLGWYGKNANVLLPGKGSWFVLGSVVTDAPIAASEPPLAVEDGCGSCRRCMVDCPTGALVAPGRLDARRCLAWLLQAPGVFPPEHREALGDRLYGCDDCQERCPVNSRSAATAPAPPAEPAARAALPALEVLAADDEAVEKMVGRWYVARREMRYVRRNALVVLGNTADPGDPRVVAALRQAIADPDPLLRGHAVWSAGRLGLVDLVVAAAADPDPYVRGEARAATFPGGPVADGPVADGPVAGAP